MSHDGLEATLEAERQQRLDFLWAEIATNTTDKDRDFTRRLAVELYDERGLPSTEP